MSEHQIRGLAHLYVDEATGLKAIEKAETGTRITMVASTSAVDRDGEVIEVEAWTWNKETLPKLLWGHNYYEAAAVIGRLTRVYRKDGKLLIDAELADKVPEATTARLVAGLLREGFLDQGSVGFLPLAWVGADGKAYTRDSGTWWGSEPGRRYTKVELLEFSIVPVPSQRESLMVGVRALGLADAPAGEAPSPIQPGMPGSKTTPDSAPALKTGMVRIVSDGTALNTKVFLPDGSDLGASVCIRRIDFTIDAAEQIGVARLLVEASADVHSETDYITQLLFTGQAAGAVPSRAEKDGDTSADDWLAGVLAGPVTRSAERAEATSQET